MILSGKVYLEDKDQYKMIEVPLLDLATQGENFEDYLPMISDAILSLDPEIKFDVKWTEKEKGLFIVESTDSRLISLILKRTREALGLSQRDAAKKMGFSSHNSIAAYESGEREPTVGKFETMLAHYGHKLMAA